VDVAAIRLGAEVLRFVVTSKRKSSSDGNDYDSSGGHEPVTLEHLSPSFSKLRIYCHIHVARRQEIVFAAASRRVAAMYSALGNDITDASLDAGFWAFWT